MKKQKTEPFVTLPNNLCKEKKYTPFDALVYMTIKSYMNNETHEAWPSYRVLEKKLNCRYPKIRDSINKMKDDLFRIRTNGQRQIYIFPAVLKEFEPFTKKFLEKEDLTNEEKGYLAVAQQFMFTDVLGFGKMSYQVKKLADLVNLSEQQIRRYDRELVNKGYLNIVNTRNIDPDTFFPLREKIFNLSLLEQNIIWELASSNKHIRKNNIGAEKKDKDTRVFAEALHNANVKTHREYVPFTIDV